tara:strand:+ start:230 stop:673 length:444 start_codon:yes stop_codon:yes gene_type:complete
VNKEISIVKSLFNPEISDGLLLGIQDYLNKNNLQDVKQNIKIYNVPGAFEIPGTVKQILNKSKSSCVICLGSVIKGETAHFDYISRGVTDGIMRLTLSTDIPIIFGVLTVYNYEQALNRVSLEGKNKGSEIIQAGLLAIETYNKINS